MRMQQSRLHKASDARAGCKGSTLAEGEARRRDHRGPHSPENLRKSDSDPPSSARHLATSEAAS